MRELIERAKDCIKRIDAMCKEGRPPRMSIPARIDHDDDLVIVGTLTEIIAALEQSEERVKEARREALEEFEVMIDHLREGPNTLTISNVKKRLRALIEKEPASER